MDIKIKVLLAFVGMAIVLLIGMAVGIFSVSYLHFTTDNHVSHSMVQAADELGLLENPVSEKIEE